MYLAIIGEPEHLAVNAYTFASSDFKSLLSIGKQVGQALCNLFDKSFPNPSVRKVEDPFKKLQLSEIETADMYQIELTSTIVSRFFVYGGQKKVRGQVPGIILICDYALQLGTQEWQKWKAKNLRILLEDHWGLLDQLVDVIGTLSMRERITIEEHSLILRVSDAGHYS